MSFCQVVVSVTFAMANFSAQVVVAVEPLTVILVSLALTAAIFANTYYNYLHFRTKWQYGLFRFIAFLGMAVLSYATAGYAALIPTLTTFLGMELQRLMQELDLHFSLNRWYKLFGKHDNGADRPTE